MEVTLEALAIFLLRLVGIAVSTLATILMVQGRRFPAVLSGSVSALVYVIAIGKVVANLDNLWNVGAYVVGFGVGTWVGMVLEQRIALGYAQVHLISAEKGEEVAVALRKAGFGATQMYGWGQHAPVAIVEALVPRKSVPELLEIAEEVDERVIAAVAEARNVQRGYWPRPRR
ncbi:MAG: DUF5698 domain-containing protein [Anaerolineae bacterium]|jgi:uncharacterized protein YebE (UPF0316 family)